MGRRIEAISIIIGFAILIGLTIWSIQLEKQNEILRQQNEEIENEIVILEEQLIHDQIVRNESPEEESDQSKVEAEQSEEQEVSD